MYVFHHKQFQEEIIRLHVVAKSDSTEDQQIKILVRDAVLKSLQKDLHNVKDMEQARMYIQNKLPYIEAVANKTLTVLGYDSAASVYFSEELFDSAQVGESTFPAGIYQALRIVIGNGEGHNWWGVIFPQCYLSVFCHEEDPAINAFSEDRGVMEEQENMEIGFWIIDFIERLGNRQSAE